MTYEFRTHSFTSADMGAHPWYPAWQAAVTQGFHEGRPSDAVLRHQLSIEAAHAATARGAYAVEHLDHALPDGQPVATFTEWTGSLNVGGALVDVLQISDVTVRASHRRRGLLRRLMTDSLRAAKERGIPIAALTATEATIYGRFGFGPAVFREEVELRVGPGFGLTTDLTGTVEFLDPESLDGVSAHVFAEFHRRQTGSIARFDADRAIYTGAIDSTTRDPEPKLRAAAHWDEQGSIDGYVTWVVEKPHEITVRDFITTNEHARLALWGFLGSLDLINVIHARGMRQSDPLPWSLADRRWYRTRNLEDFIWLRVLDTPSVLRARNYVHDGDVSLRVVDNMGLADGAWRLAVRDGVGYVESTSDADVEIDVAALGSALLDGVRLGTLVAAGLVRGERRSVDMLEGLLSRRRAPWCATGF